MMTNEYGKFKFFSTVISIIYSKSYDTRLYTTFSYFIQSLMNALSETHIKKNLKRIISITTHSI